jgi:hypothetical protein
MTGSDRRLVTLLAILFGITFAYLTTSLTAHGGGLDAIGGHRDTKAGNYHVHQGTCSGRSFASKEAAIRAGCRR